ncbi:MAG: imidazole glycerol phosphate synthase subunit HisH [Planktomarina sp.]|nr:imidazole glycerol phosphate synthase subunit HisH [Planktomarina sp.]
MKTVIVNSGCANIASVKFAFERLGASVYVSSDIQEISKADRVILPGVGTFDFAMSGLVKNQLINAIKSLKQPVLGICLGMQLYFDGSAEGVAQGLGLAKGMANKFLSEPNLPVPHMGWNQLENLSDDPLLKGLDEGAYVYFVHSYFIPLGETTLAETTYGKTFSASVRRKNFWGCQFHPERSGDVGATILHNFLNLS